jgi:alkanesulfonate monooxygenase SsuD/methylene tetrahydromethanopterin reductase-like flavin-dependent oxidoreductase (luciferase family)
MKRGLYLAPFDELANPRLLAELARAAESVGWDGLFLWDRIDYPPRERAVADPWVALGAIASVTETLGLGPMITPLSRRRVQKLARETVTLDLSNGRLTLGVPCRSSGSRLGTRPSLERRVGGAGCGGGGRPPRWCSPGPVGTRCGAGAGPR